MGVKSCVRYYKTKERVVECEQVILRTFVFDVDTMHPLSHFPRVICSYVYFLNCCKSLEVSTEVVQCGWSVILDSYLCNKRKCYPPPLLAVAALYIALRLLQAPEPRKEWWRVFEIGYFNSWCFLVVKRSSPRAVWTYCTCTLLLFVINKTQEWDEDTNQNDSTNNNNDQHTALSLPILFRFLDRLFECLIRIIHTRCRLGDLAITFSVEMHVHLNLVDALSLLVHEEGEVHEHLIQLHHRSLDVQHRHVRLFHLTYVGLDRRVHVAHHRLGRIGSAEHYSSDRFDALPRLNHLIDLRIGLVQHGLQNSLHACLHVCIVFYLGCVVILHRSRQLADCCI